MRCWWWDLLSFLFWESMVLDEGIVKVTSVLQKPFPTFSWKINFYHSSDHISTGKIADMGGNHPGWLGSVSVATEKWIPVAQWERWINDESDFETSWCQRVNMFTLHFNELSVEGKGDVKSSRFLLEGERCLQQFFKFLLPNPKGVSMKGTTNVKCGKGVSQVIAWQKQSTW